MARQIAIDLPDDNVKEARVLDMACESLGYQDKIPNPVNLAEMIDNPQTKKQFIKKYLADHLKNLVVMMESQKAAEKGRRNAETKAREELEIT